MKFITEISELEKYRAIGNAIDDIKNIMSFSEIAKLREKKPEGKFESKEQELEAAANQGYKNILDVVKNLCLEHPEEMMRINHLFWKPEVIKKPVVLTEYDEEGFPVEVYKKDEQGHIVFEDYQETENDYPSVFRTILKLPILAEEMPEVKDFFMWSVRLTGIL